MSSPPSGSSSTWCTLTLSADTRPTHTQASIVALGWVKQNMQNKLRHGLDKLPAQADGTVAIAYFLNLPQARNFTGPRGAWAGPITFGDLQDNMCWMDSGLDQNGRRCKPRLFMARDQDTKVSRVGAAQGHSESGIITDLRCLYSPINDDDKAGLW